MDADTIWRWVMLATARALCDEAERSLRAGDRERAALYSLACARMLARMRAEGVAS